MGNINEGLTCICLGMATPDSSRSGGVLYALPEKVAHSGGDNLNFPFMLAFSSFCAYAAVRLDPVLFRMLCWMFRDLEDLVTMTVSHGPKAVFGIPRLFGSAPRDFY